MGEMVWKELPAAAVEAEQAVKRQHQLPLTPPGKANVTSQSSGDHKIPTLSLFLLIPGGLREGREQC